jgi:hypothetical protein
MGQAFRRPGAAHIGGLPWYRTLVFSTRPPYPPAGGNDGPCLPRKASCAPRSVDGSATPASVGPPAAVISSRGLTMRAMLWACEGRYQTVHLNRPEIHCRGTARPGWTCLAAVDIDVQRLPDKIIFPFLGSLGVCRSNRGGRNAR